MMASVAEKPSKTIDEPTTKSLNAALKKQREKIRDDQKATRAQETRLLNKIIRNKPSDKLSDKNAEFINDRNNAIKKAHRRGATDAELKLCGVDVVRLSNGPEIGRVSDALMEVHKGNLKYSDIDIFFNDKLTNAQQNTIFRAVTGADGNRDMIYEIARIAKPEHTIEEMKMAISKIKEGKSHDEIDAVFLLTEIKKASIFADKNDDKGTPIFNDEQKKVIQSGFDKGMGKRQITLIARPELNPKQMLEIIKGYEKGLNTKEITLYSKPVFSAKQMEMLRHALVHHVPYNEVKKIAKPSIPADEMRGIVTAAVDRVKNGSVKAKVNTKANVLEETQKNKPILTHANEKKAQIGLEGT